MALFHGIARGPESEMIYKSRCMKKMTEAVVQQCTWAIRKNMQTVNGKGDHKRASMRMCLCLHTPSKRTAQQMSRTNE